MSKDLPRVTDLLEFAFRLSFLKYPELHTKWAKISLLVGGKIPALSMTMTILKAGQLDLLLRTMEVERSTTPSDQPPYDSLSFQVYFSQLWVCQLYEILRTLKERKFVPETDDFKMLMRDLKLLRITFDKHELADDRSLKGKPIALSRVPIYESEQDEPYIYSKEDPKRGHSMPMTISKKGAIMWAATDILKRGNLTG
jgi:hypothetical protein